MTAATRERPVGAAPSVSVRTRAVRILTVALIGAFLWLAARKVRGQWDAVRAASAGLDPAWGLLLLSGAIVVATYAVLAHAWRLLVAASGVPVSLANAFRIHSVARLGLYVPGRVWQMAAMTMMARRLGVSAGVATGAAVVGTLVNIAAAFAVVLLAGSRVLDTLVAARVRTLASVLAGGVTLGLLLLPVFLPWLARTAVRWTRRSTPLPTVGTRTLALVVLLNVVAWIGYGLAFALLVRALFPASAGNWVEHVALFTGSYLVGYLAIVLPGGVGAREAAMVAGLQSLGLAGSAEALILAAASRLWLTVFEVVPGLLYLARDAALRSPPSSLDASS